MAAPAPAAASSVAISAPPANGARKKLVVASSPMAKITAAISQITQESMFKAERIPRGLSGEKCASEVVGVERPQVFELLADADQLHGNPELVGDRECDAPLRGAVE